MGYSFGCFRISMLLRQAAIDILIKHINIIISTTWMHL